MPLAPKMKKEADKLSVLLSGVIQSKLGQLAKQGINNPTMLRQMVDQALYAFQGTGLAAAKREVISTLIKAGKPELANAVAHEVTARMDHDHAYAIVSEAMRVELGEPGARRHLFAWFRETAWARIYQPRAFEQAVDALVRSERLKRIGGKILDV